MRTAPVHLTDCRRIARRASAEVGRNSEMSSGRSRSGGIRTGKTFNGKQITAEAPGAHVFCQISIGGVTMRTSTRIGSLRPAARIHAPAIRAAA